MSRVRIYPGAVTDHSIRGLLLTDAAAGPTLQASPAGKATVESMALPPKLGPHLEGVRALRFRVTGLPAGTRCDLKAECAGAAPHATSFRTLDPGARSLEVVVASCFYEGFAYSPAYANMLRSSWCKDAAFKVLAGDNLYMDVHSRQRDSSLEDGWEETAYLYLKYWWHSAAYADVLATLPTFTTFDDHEYWNNYPEEQFWLSRSKPRMRDDYVAAGNACVDAFQVSLNPEPAAAGTRSYSISGTPLVDFFVADVRSERTRKGSGDWRMMPKAARDAMLRWIRGRERPGVLVIGQPLVIGAGGGTDYNPPAFGTEFTDLWEALGDAPWDVMVLSGDVHHSRVLELTLPGQRRVFEVVTSPASHIPTNWSTVWGSYSSQGQDAVEFPELVRYGTGSAELARHGYLFGTDASNSIATLRFDGAGGGAVDVGCRFLDLVRGGPAGATNANEGWFRSGLRPVYRRCEHDRLFKLGRR
jgi:hypothetical protein